MILKKPESAPTASFLTRLKSSVSSLFYVASKSLSITLLLPCLKARKKSKTSSINSKTIKLPLIFTPSLKAIPPTLILSLANKAMALIRLSKPKSLSLSFPLPALAAASSPPVYLSSTTNINAVSKLAMPNLKPSPSGIFRSNTPSILPTKSPLLTFPTKT